MFPHLKYAIYMSSIDYMVASYGPFSSSASAGNAFARDGLAGAASLYATPSTCTAHPYMTSGTVQLTHFLSPHETKCTTS